MQTKTFRKITPDTTRSIKGTEAAVGSDEYTAECGYHQPSKVEQKRYGKFVNRERFFSVVRGAS
jgi:hypothetical protein